MRVLCKEKLKIIFKIFNVPEFKNIVTDEYLL